MWNIHCSCNEHTIANRSEGNGDLATWYSPFLRKKYLPVHVYCIPIVML
ncbi:hypothetical protein Leryth_023113 [Lithospermum erythrorhizon]|nr:hypothetical protein Leryth_023113 [Lithospermum erythrorhizon]